MIDLLAHWLHLMAAAVWAGGTLAVVLVVQPALRAGLETGQRMVLYRAIGAHFSMVQWACWTVLLVTGAHKLRGMGVSPGFFLQPFGAVLALKLCLVGALVGSSLLHAYRWGPVLLESAPGEPRFQSAAAKLALWGRVNAALMALIVLCAAGLRFNPWWGP